MERGVSRRDVLKIGGVSAAAGLSGCSTIRGLTPPDTDLEMIVTNREPEEDHTVEVRLVDPDADDLNDGVEYSRDFELAAKPPAGAEESNTNRKSASTEARRYYLRVRVPHHVLSHYHYYPCHGAGGDGLYINVVRDEAADDLSIEYYRPAHNTICD